jgi:pyrroline-5-carboxylate reductase
LATTDIIMLCVKPHQIQSAIKMLMTKRLRPDTLIISIAAGVTLATLQQALPANAPVIRAMTNTPCQVAQGMTVICAGEHATADHMAKAQQIFDAVGQCLDMDESYFDAVTGLCGSGPAYMYLIMEALADGGVRVGLPREKAIKLVAQTVLGAATMVQQTGRHPASLKDDVTTPAGCTIGALLSMEDGKIRSVLARAVEEATRIASGLGYSRSNN